jgi:hypothetical protein
MNWSVSKLRELGIDGVWFVALVRGVGHLGRNLPLYMCFLFILDGRWFCLSEVRCYLVKLEPVAMRKV